jgi:putative flippase GtrA
MLPMFPARHSSMRRRWGEAVPIVPPQSPTLPIAHKFGRFLLVGGLCTGLQYLLLVALVEGLGLSATIASTIGYAASSVVNYFLNYSFTFNSAQRHRRSLPRFVLIGVFGLLLNGAVTFVGTSIYGVHYLLAQVAATIVTLLWNFLANLRWTF